MGNFETFKLVNEGNFVISLRSFQGGLEYSKYRGIVSPAYNVMEENAGQNRMYYKYLMKSKMFISELQRNVTGIRQGKNIDVNDFKEIVLPIPSLPEQDQIVKYLDNKLAKINKFIKVKKKLIAVLKEKKQAIINQAVTKGLDPKVKMKPSGIEWLRDVPDHWNVMYCKRPLTVLADYTANGSFADLAKNVTYLDEGFARLVRLTDLRVGLSNKGVYVSEHSYKYLEKSSLFGGEFLIANVGAYAGLSCIMPKIEMPATLGPNMMMAKFDIDLVETEFISSAFNSEYIQTQLKIKANNTAAQPKINKDDFKNVQIVLPSIKEQKQILKWLDSKSVLLDGSIKKLEDEITLIAEYRNRLISDVVSGKVDVRNIIIEDNEAVDLQKAGIDEILADEETLDVEEGDE